MLAQFFHLALAQGVARQGPAVAADRDIGFTRLIGLVLALLVLKHGAAQGACARIAFFRRQLANNGAGRAAAAADAHRCARLRALDHLLALLGAFTDRRCHITGAGARLTSTATVLERPCEKLCLTDPGRTSASGEAGFFNSSFGRPPRLKTFLFS